MKNKKYVYNQIKFKILKSKTVARKKNKTLKTTKKVKQETKNYIFWFLFIFLWIISFIQEVESTLWFHMYNLMYYLFGSFYKLIFAPIFIFFWIGLFFKDSIILNSSRIFGLFLYFFSLTTIIWFFYTNYYGFFNFYDSLSWFLWSIATFIFSIFLFLFSLYLVFRISYKNIIKKVITYTPQIEDIKSKLRKEVDNIEDIKETKNSKKISKKFEKEKEELERKEKNIAQRLQKLQELEEMKEKKSKQTTLNDAPYKIKIEKKENSFLDKVKSNFTNSTQENTNSKTGPSYSSWKLPDTNLLSDIWWNIEYDEYEIEKKEIEIVEKLKQFKIDVNMVWYRVWPTVIQFRLKPEEWVKLNKIENLKKDLTLALHAKSIRIQAPIPWEWVVGIEVPNENRQPVWLKELINCQKFHSNKVDIPLAVWKDVNGDLVIWDLTRMPHLLIAWQTGSWKSVWMNGFLISLLYKFSPSELKMIMVDPKRVELSIYNWIPHLLTPVITNPDKALNALKWAVAEMLRRYDLATSVWARNLKEYNKKVKKDEKLPYIVIVVDELADLMMSWNKKEVESSIARIAQMARAVWMHLILATQRPSVDVITWLIKANIPSRIAFTVASQIDSRTIVDKVWAEDLLGRWDMLYFPTWNLAPERVQWVLVETEEVEAIVNQIKLTVDPDMVNNLYDDSIVNGKSKLEWSILEWYNWEQEEEPEIIEKAIQVVKESKKWSTSLIQRKLWLWYARAAKVLDILEELWVVWPSNWSKPRDVYVD